jgi:hypothetical protein
MAFDAAAELSGPTRVVPNPLAQTTGAAALGLKVQSLRRGVAAIQSNYQKIGTELDFVVLRKKIIGQIQKAVELTDEIENGIRRATVAASSSRDYNLQQILVQLAAQFNSSKSELVLAVRETQRLEHQYEPVDLHTHGSSDGAESSDARESAAPGRRNGTIRQQKQEVVIEMANFGAVDAAIIEVCYLYVLILCVNRAGLIPLSTDAGA